MSGLLRAGSRWLLAALLVPAALRGAEVDAGAEQALVFHLMETVFLGSAGQVAGLGGDLGMLDETNGRQLVVRLGTQQPGAQKALHDLIPDPGAVRRRLVISCRGLDGVLRFHHQVLECAHGYLWAEAVFYSSLTRKPQIVAFNCASYADADTLVEKGITPEEYVTVDGARLQKPAILALGASSIDLLQWLWHGGAQADDDRLDFLRSVEGDDFTREHLAANARRTHAQRSAAGLDEITASRVLLIREIPGFIRRMKVLSTIGTSTMISDLVYRSDADGGCHLLQLGYHLNGDFTKTVGEAFNMAELSPLGTGE